MDVSSQNSIPLNKRVATNDLESPRKRFAMFATNEKDPNTTLIDLSTADEIAVLPLSNHPTQNDMDITGDKKVRPLFQTLKSDRSRGSLAPGLGNAPKCLTIRFIANHHFVHILYMM